MADILARLSVISSEPPVEPMCSIQLEDIIQQQEKLSFLEASEEVEQEFSTKGIKRKHVSFLLQGPWFKDLNRVNRRTITLMVRFKSTHVVTGPHLVRKNIKDSEACDCGWSSRNLEHIF